MDRRVEMSSNDNSDGKKFAGLYDVLLGIGLNSPPNDTNTGHLSDFLGQFPPVTPPQNRLSLSDLLAYGLTPSPNPLSSVGRAMLPPPPSPSKRNASLKADLQREVADTFRAQWETRDGSVVPAYEGIRLDNHGVKLKEATVLYADLAESTGLVDGYIHQFAAEIYKTFLNCAAKIIRSEGGEITAYDGDRIMAVYVGGVKNTSAVRTALKINWAVQEIIGPALRAVYTKTAYQVKYKIGIDTSELLVAKTGVRGANDLVWIGRSANSAAKLSSLPDTYRTYITGEVHDVLDPSVKDKKDINGWPMWEPQFKTGLVGRTVYASNWLWPLG
jgi:class 3 adenylate cyclase